jgi:hypothetical protein
MATNKEHQSYNEESPIIGNVLDKFDQATYHFRLFVTKERVNSTLPSSNAFSSSAGVLPPSATVGVDEKIFLLAETGSTRISIDNVEIESIPVSSQKTKTSTFTSVNFDLYESGSVVFFDELA